MGDGYIFWECQLGSNYKFNLKRDEMKEHQQEESSHVYDQGNRDPRRPVTVHP